MTDADDKAAALVLEIYRENEPTSHLATCPEVEVKEAEATDGQYGCDTGCEYYQLEAQLVCPHQELRYEYGDFGQIADFIERMG